MATLKQRIEGYIGTVTETAVMDSSLQEAVNNLVQVLPVDKALQYATEKTATGSTGISISGRVFDVRVEDRPSKQVSTRNFSLTSIKKPGAFRLRAFLVHWGETPGPS